MAAQTEFDDGVAGKARLLWNTLKLLPGGMWVPYLAVAFLIAGAFGVNEWSIEAISHSGQQIERLMQIQRELGVMRSALVDAETGERGYLISRDPRFLDPYRAALEAMPKALTTLKKMSEDDPALTDMLASLDELQRRKLEFAASVVELARRGEVARSSALISTGRGKILMDAFRLQTDRALERVGGRLSGVYAEQAVDIRYSRYAELFVGILAVGLMLLVLRLLIRQTARQALQRRDLEVEVSRRTRDLFELSTHLQLVQEREKAELARNLHDELGGLMTAAKMDIAWVQEAPAALDPDLRGKLGEIAKILESAMGVKRRVVEGLRPALLDHFGAATAISTYVQENCERAGLEPKVSIDPDFDSVDPQVALATFRVVQEALTNTIRHAGAKRFMVKLISEGPMYVLWVADDGRGMGAATRRGSHGVVGMKHRILAIGGTVDIASTAGRGTRLEIRFPRKGASANTKDDSENSGASAS